MMSVARTQRVSPEHRVCCTVRPDPASRPAPSRSAASTFARDVVHDVESAPYYTGLIDGLTVNRGACEVATADSIVNVVDRLVHGFSRNFFKYASTDIPWATASFFSVEL